MPNIHTDQHPAKLSENITIGQLWAQGKPANKIATILNIPEKTIEYRLRTSDACRDVIEQTLQEHALMLPLATSKHKEHIKSDTERISLDAIKLSYQTTGILSTHTGGNVFNTQVNIGQSAKDFFADDDAQEAEYEDVIDV